MSKNQNNTADSAVWKDRLNLDENTTANASVVGDNTISINDPKGNPLMEGDAPGSTNGEDSSGLTVNNGESGTTNETGEGSTTNNGEGGTTNETGEGSTTNNNGDSNPGADNGNSGGGDAGGTENGSGSNGTGSNTSETAPVTSVLHTDHRNKDNITTTEIDYVKDLKDPYDRKKVTKDDFNKFEESYGTPLKKVVVEKETTAVDGFNMNGATNVIIRLISGYNGSYFFSFEKIHKILFGTKGGLIRFEKEPGLINETLVEKVAKGFLQTKQLNGVLYSKARRKEAVTRLLTMNGYTIEKIEKIVNAESGESDSETGGEGGNGGTVEPTPPEIEKP